MGLQKKKKIQHPWHFFFQGQIDLVFRTPDAINCSNLKHFSFLSSASKGYKAKRSDCKYSCSQYLFLFHAIKLIFYILIFG